MDKKIIYIDMDGVIANFKKAADEALDYLQKIEDSLK